MRFDLDSSWSPRFWNRVQRHASTWLPSSDLLARLADGTALFVSGGLIAQTRYLAARLPRLEFVVAWATDGFRPWLMSHLFLPREQALTGSHCEATGRAMLEIGRRAEAMRGRVAVTMMVHSHASFSASFLSWIDVETIRALADDGIARQTSQWQDFAPALTPDPSADPSRWLLTFPDQPGVSLALASLRPGITAEDVSVRLRIETRRTVSCFGVVNSAGELFLPTFRRTTCGLCGSTVREALDGSDVELHILGPEIVSSADRQSLEDQLAAMTVLSSTGSSYPDARGTATTRRPSGYHLSASPDLRSDSVDVSPADYGIWRNGELQGRIPAALMERVAAQIPEVAECLGWRDSFSAALSASDDADSGAIQAVEPLPTDKTVSED